MRLYGVLVPPLRDWLAVSLLFVLACWIFWPVPSWPQSPDGEFHLQRTRALVEALGQGVFYPRWFPDFAFGYGHPILHYYSPGYYYLPTLLNLLGMDILFASWVTAGIISWLTAIACYAALRLTVEAPASLFGATIYLLFPYHLYDFFVRGALPETMAFLWQPLIVATTILLLRRPSRSWLPALGLAFAWAGLILTHNLSALMIAILAVVALPALALAPGFTAAPGNYRTRFTWICLRFGGATLLGISLAAFYVLPVAFEVNWVSVGSGPNAPGYARHFATWDTLFQFAWRYQYPTASDLTVPLPVWLLPLLILAIMTLRRAKHRLALLMTLACTLITLWLLTYASAPFWDFGADILRKLSFPWRWQSPLTLSVALLSGYLWSEWGRSHSRALVWGATLIMLCLLLVYTNISDVASDPSGPVAITPQSMWAFEATHGQIGTTWMGEFMPRWITLPRAAIGVPQATVTPTSPVVGWQAQLEQVGYLHATYAIQAASPLTLTFDQFYFPAWQVQIDGEPKASVAYGELGLLAVPLPAGEHTVALQWHATRAVWLGRLLTTLGWAVALALFWRAKRPYLLGAWLVVGGIALAGISGITNVVTTPPRVAVQYPELSLISATVMPQADRADVTLYWANHTAVTPLTVFVHIVGPDSNVIAQWDEPVGGLYRPATQWTANFLVRQQVAVPLPTDLAPGSYAVLVGLYEPGSAAAPLVPLDQENPRVEIGALVKGS